MIERPATRDDLPAVLDLFCRYEQRYRGFADSDAEDVTQDWDSPGFDMGSSTRVLEQDGRVVGYAVVDDAGWADTVTDPDRPDDRLVVPLLDWLESRGGALEHFVPDSDTALQEVLRSRGWVPVRIFWRMRLELDGPQPEPVLPAGVLIRDYRRPADDQAVHALLTAALGESDETPRTLEQWRAFLLDTEKFDPSLYLVAERAGTVVGAALSQDTGAYGFLRQLGVSRAERGSGLGLALLRETIRRHAARGLPATVLGVNAANPTGALRLYEKAGMTVHEQFTRWEKPARA